ncbi:thymine dioxygenase [Pyrenophora tritici-repentis]|uniref:Thymine dioxygenase n=2 Tax=Pyrenophora tritici-repentis TaxID=45151 RepID=A0A2W1DJ93_9PLEO|nr:thymine dioxygenase [Pyrenophora tritici-repentis Pt-1C-BFP]KAA8621827.1 Thymine dioxygenase [Pyrenophora tritici-repentis]EDU42854.1 thymine dioxygenase [Pyrenophora tritici-repentis Pt-1C-BFP]KAF7451047.1 Thymine dioxygenase [Pyrenophora tritici-repentis]KAF7573728.1 thymine dioxygenase [Pyrenophora tritici-repentis]KAG9380737.1 Thymine dioxygenase [Pyrenophora tritici-repentis]
MANITVGSAVSQDDLEIPLIDFDAFLSGDPNAKKQTADAVLKGFQNAGFVYLKNHGIPPSTVSTVFSHSAKFFARPKEQKDALAWYSAAANRGYTAQGREKLVVLEETGTEAEMRALVPDLKESMEIGRDDQPEMPNMWPSGDEAAKEFKEQMVEFFETCKNLHMQIMRAIALGMGIEEMWFDGFTDAGDNTLRLLHYPGVSKSIFKRNDGQQQVRAGEHSDYGSITLLFQDARGGLQVRSPKGTFVDATPIEGTIVINAGDLLARWSNDTIKSTKHRVMEPPPKPEDADKDEYPPRYSIAYFCNPNADRKIEAIPGTFENGRKYDDVMSGDYLIQRLTATY